jgi:hypothetical protein
MSPDTYFRYSASTPDFCGEGLFLRGAERLNRVGRELSSPAGAGWTRVVGTAAAVPDDIRLRYLRIYTSYS